jgi:hypothetical protein
MTGWACKEWREARRDARRVPGDAPRAPGDARRVSGDSRRAVSESPDPWSESRRKRSELPCVRRAYAETDSVPLRSRGARRRRVSAALHLLRHPRMTPGDAPGRWIAPRRTERSSRRVRTASRWTRGASGEVARESQGVPRDSRALRSDARGTRGDSRGTNRASLHAINRGRETSLARLRVHRGTLSRRGVPLRANRASPFASERPLRVEGELAQRRGRSRLAPRASLHALRRAHPVRISAVAGARASRRAARDALATSCRRLVKGQRDENALRDAERGKSGARSALSHPPRVRRAAVRAPRASLRVPWASLRVPCASLLVVRESLAESSRAKIAGRVPLVPSRCAACRLACARSR